MCLIPLLGLLAIYLHDGEIGTPFWIAFILYLLFILPGVIYSILVVVDAI
ncbi:MAG: YqaE/Pmp3 family membrane protein [Bacteroidetes bacterium]|nr:YqaE/Pmp3 family membrane protein [Bacteroidota bacterium]